VSDRLAAIDAYLSADGGIFDRGDMGYLLDLAHRADAAEAERDRLREAVMDARLAIRRDEPGYALQVLALSSSHSAPDEPKT